MSEAAAQFQPVFITAPTARNGVTLLQRLLNSSRQIIIYGENKHFCEMLPNVVHTAHHIHLNSHQQMEATRQRFLNETTEFWSSGLWPDTKMYLDLSVRVFRQFAQLYQACSEQYGYKRWGIKHPFVDVAAFDRFLSLLPTSKFLYLYRNPYDVARSSKARKFTKTPADFQALMTAWRNSVMAALQAEATNLMVIKYEELLHEPDAWISKIESFTGVTNIDRDVMNKKFNTFRGQERNGHSPTEYVPPAALTDEEAAVITEVAGNVLTALNYTDEKAAEAAPATA